jgi:excinuclease UvrABC ATPase subunit
MWHCTGKEVSLVDPIEQQDQRIALQSCTLTWPQDRSIGSAASSVASTPRRKFVLLDLTLDFPIGELTLVCGKLGSGKTLLLLGVFLNVLRCGVK